MKIVKVVLINVALIAIVLIAAEGVARLLEEPNVSTVPVVGPDPELGWAPLPNVQSTHKSHEFAVEVHTNELGLYSDPIDEMGERSRIRILALGDSHTAASGVSTDEAWPNVLERLLGERGWADATVYNAGVGAYSLDQYLTRFRKLADRLWPHVVIIGFSTATDFYDVGRLPSGGFVYGADVGRIYYELDASNSLIERGDLAGTSLSLSNGSTASTSLRVRGWLQRLALYRHLKRSQVAFWIAARWRPGGESLWPGLDTALKTSLDEEDRRRLVLAEKLIGRIADEAQSIGAVPVLLHIPYLAQVYDSVWSASFGGLPDRYDRDLPSERLAAIAQRYNLVFVDSYPQLRDEARARDKWLHHRIDGHPTHEGQEIIARVVMEAVTNLKIDPGRQTLDSSAALPIGAASDIP